LLLTPSLHLSYIRIRFHSSLFPRSSLHSSLLLFYLTPRFILSLVTPLLFSFLFFFLLLPSISLLFLSSFFSSFSLFLFLLLFSSLLLLLTPSLSLLSPFSLLAHSYLTPLLLLSYSSLTPLLLLSYSLLTPLFFLSLSPLNPLSLLYHSPLTPLFLPCSSPLTLLLSFSLLTPLFLLFLSPFTISLPISSPLLFSPFLSFPFPTPSFYLLLLTYSSSHLLLLLIFSLLSPYLLLTSSLPSPPFPLTMLMIMLLMVVIDVDDDIIDVCNIIIIIEVDTFMVLRSLTKSYSKYHKCIYFNNAVTNININNIIIPSHPPFFSSPFFHLIYIFCPCPVFSYGAFFTWGTFSLKSLFLPTPS